MLIYVVIKSANQVAEQRMKMMQLNDKSFG